MKQSQTIDQSIERMKEINEILDSSSDVSVEDMMSLIEEFEALSCTVDAGIITLQKKLDNMKESTTGSE